MDKRCEVQSQIERLNDLPGVPSLAMNSAIALLRGWYQNFKPTAEDMKTWIYLMRDLDPELFIPAVEEWGRNQPEWAPTAPQFRQVVERLDAERQRTLRRTANVARLESSKLGDRRIRIRTRER